MSFFSVFIGIPIDCFDFSSTFAFAIFLGILYLFAPNLFRRRQRPQNDPAVKGLTFANQDEGSSTIPPIADLVAAENSEQIPEYPAIDPYQQQQALYQVPAYYPSNSPYPQAPVYPNDIISQNPENPILPQNIPVAYPQTSPYVMESMDPHQQLNEKLIPK